MTDMVQSKNVDSLSKLKRMIAGLSSMLLITGILVVGTTQVASAASAVSPSRVKGVVASAGNASATVSWFAPGFSGSSAVNRYVASTEDGSFSCSTSGATSCTITGLTNGSAYRFIVTAANSAGSSTPSAVSKLVTPLTVASAPRSVTTLPGIKSVKVSWVNPISNGGSAIKGFVVTSSPENKTCKSNLLPTCTVKGLTPGQSYMFFVTANNKAGVSPLAYSGSVSPLGIPSAPTGVSSSTQGNTVTVTWNEPQSNGGSAILRYRVTSSPSGYNCTTATTSCSFTALNKSARYTFNVVAINALGSSPVGRADTAITNVAAALPPTNVQAISGNNQAIVSWVASVSNGGSEVITYTVTSNPGGLTCTTTSTSCLVTGLTNYLKYSFTVTATNSAGTSN